MKFLLFNLVVAASLYYLFHTGELSPGAAEARVQTVANQVGRSRRVASPEGTKTGIAVTETAPAAPPTATGKRPLERPVPSPSPRKRVVAATRETPPAHAPGRTSQKRPPHTKPAPVAASATKESAPRPKAHPPRRLPPEVAQRRAEVLGEVAVTSIPTTPAPVVISATLRRRELQALAEEMEFRALEWGGD